MLKAKDIMRTDLVTALPNQTQMDVLRQLSENNITGLPVADPMGNLLGIITEKDMLIFAYRIIAQDVARLDNKKIAQVMSDKVVGVKPDDSLADVCQFFLNKPFRRLPVVEDGKIIGLISRKDVIQCAFKEAKESVLA